MLESARPNLRIGMAPTVTQKDSKGPAHIRQPRRQILVNRPYQLRAVFPVVVYGGLLFALTLAFVFLPEHHQVAADPDQIIRAIRTAELLRLEVWLAPFLVLCG